jgi:putative hydrolase of the HAD superfamily
VGALAVARVADLDAVTLDAYGTLVTLRDPVPALERRLREHGVERDAGAIRIAFEEEGAYYVPRSLEGRDADSLASLRRECAAVFLGALGTDLDPAEFVDAYISALVFEPLNGVPERLARLRALGLPLAVIGNWDCSLGERLAELRLAHFFEFILSSAEAGVAKPDRRIFELALERLGVRPERALHVGDQPADEDGARAAGMHFAPAPLTDALAAWR